MPTKHSKRYINAVKVADLTKDYPLKEAVEILAKFPKAKFDETIELSFRLGVDATSGEQNVRGTTPLQAAMAADQTAIIAALQRYGAR